MQQLYFTVLVILGFVPFFIQSSQKNQPAYAKRKAIKLAQQEKELIERIQILKQHFEEVDKFKLHVATETPTNSIYLRNLPKANNVAEMNDTLLGQEVGNNKKLAIRKLPIIYPRTGEDWEVRPRLHPQHTFAIYFLKQNGIDPDNYVVLPQSHSAAPRKKISDNKPMTSPYKSHNIGTVQQFYSKNRINKNAVPKKLEF